MFQAYYYDFFGQALLVRAVTDYFS